MRSSIRRATPFFLLVAAILFAGCASTKNEPKIPAVVGAWDFTVLDTPQGDAPGVLVVGYEEEALTGEYTIDMLMQTVPITDVTFTADTLKFKAVLDVNGQSMPISTVATLEGDALDGKMEVSGFGEMSCKGTRKVVAEE